MGITILATLNFLFGGFWMLTAFSCYLLYALVVWFGSVISFGILSPQKIHESLSTHTAGLFIGLTVQAFLIGPLTILSGWGLLRLRAWGRWLNIAVGPIAGVNLVALIILSINSFDSGGVIFLTVIGGFIFVYPALLSLCMARPAMAEVFPSSRPIRR